MKCFLAWSCFCKVSIPSSPSCIYHHQPNKLMPSYKAMAWAGVRHTWIRLSKDSWYDSCISCSSLGFTWAQHLFLMRIYEPFLLLLQTIDNPMWRAGRTVLSSYCTSYCPSLTLAMPAVFYFRNPGNVHFACTKHCLMFSSNATCWRISHLVLLVGMTLSPSLTMIYLWHIPRQL